MENTVRTETASCGLLKQGDSIVIGLSGGPDSVCLFFALLELRETLDLKIRAVHVNHLLRPGACDEDEAYVKKICAENGVPVSVTTCDCAAFAQERGVTCEEAGREIRYKAFDEECRRLESEGVPKESIKIAVAHNADDRAETVLFRIVRGTGTDGLAGIEKSRTSEGGYEIVRPLLGVSRQEIEAYCREKNLSPRIDESNLEPVYTRNKIRLGLLPYISENFNSNIKEALLRLADIAECDREYLRKEAMRVYGEALVSENADEIVLSRSVIAEADKAISSRVVRMAAAKLGCAEDTGLSHVEAVLDLIARAATGKTIELPSGLTVYTRYDKVAFGKMRCGAPEFTVDVKRKSFAEYEEYAADHAAVKDFVAVESEAFRGRSFEVRTRRSGDFIILSSGRKKLQDFFTDSKIPRDLRDKVLLVVSGSEVLDIVGADSGLGVALPERSRFTSAGRPEAGKEVLILEIRAVK